MKVELVNIAFSVDSTLVAVAMSRKTWVVLTGGLLGIVAISTTDEHVEQSLAAAADEIDRVEPGLQ